MDLSLGQVVRGCSNEWDCPGLEELTAGQVGALIPLSPGRRRAWKQRCDEQKGLRNFWGGRCEFLLEFLLGRDRSLIPVVSMCLELSVSDNCASWRVLLSLQREGRCGAALSSWTLQWWECPLAALAVTIATNHMPACGFGAHEIWLVHLSG